MKKVFHDKNGMECIFNDDGVLFCDKLRRIYYPYGCLDSINISLLGVMQAVCRSQVCCIAVAHRDKAEAKEMVRFAREAMKTAPNANAVVLDLAKCNVDQSLPNEEQLKQYKALFVQGILSKEEYDLQKRFLTE